MTNAGNNDIEEKLLTTSVFDVVRLPEINGLKPVRIDAPDWCAIIVERRGMFAVVKQLRYGLMKKMVEFPCGQVEPGEAASFAAVRELAEETGIKLLNPAGDLVSLGSDAANPAIMKNFMHYFYVNLDTSSYEIGEQNLDEHEKLSFEWMPIKNFVSNALKSGCSVFMGAAMNKYLAMKIAGMGVFA